MRPIRFITWLTTAALVIPALAHPAPAMKTPPLLQPRRPDLVVSSLTAGMVGPNLVEYTWTITNVGAANADLDGRTSAESDNLCMQAVISKDTLYRNADDLFAGGGIIGRSPLGILAPGESRTGTVRSSIPGDPRTHPYLILKVDSGDTVTEANEQNNLAVVGIAR